MKLFEHKINGKKYTFVCDSWSNSRNWGHECKLMINGGYELASERVTYYNRTWEAYQYQSIMRNVVYNQLERLELELKDNYKRNNNIKRMTEKTQADFQKELKKDSFYQDLKKLRGKIK